MPTTFHGIRVRDLFVRPRPAPQVEARQPLLYCPRCGATYSATPGDYWNLPEDHVFTCSNGHRQTRCRLVDRRVQYVDVRGEVGQ